MDEETAQLCNVVALVGAPMVAAGISGVLALQSGGSEEVTRRRAFRGTLILGVVLGAAAGVVIDILHPGFMPPATFVLGGVEVPLSAGAGFVVGRVCVGSVRRRHSPQDREKIPRESNSASENVPAGRTR